MTFDPKAEFERCETLMLDMDGTILDLAFDNFMWLTHVPRCWAEINGMSFDEARAHLAARYGKIQGELHWYCLDHWSERLGLDVMQLHRDNHERIDYLPGAREFLEVVSQRDITVLLVTNSHPDTLQLKEEVTGLSQFFDGVHSSHSFGFAKEQSQFWDALRAAEPFDPATTMFVDDTHRVLRSAAHYGVANPVVVTRPDTSVPRRENGEFVGIEGVAGLLP